MSSLQYPIHALCRGFEPDSVFAGGGGGRSNTGVPNCFQSFSISNDRLTRDDPIPTDDCVTGLASYSDADTKYLAAAVGPEIRLMDATFSVVGRFETGMAKPIFRGLVFNADGTLLLAVDGDDRLRLLTVPELKEIHSQEANRATFFRGQVAAATSDAIVLYEATEEFKEVVSTKGIGLTPRALQSDGDFLFFAGHGGDRKSAIICFDAELKVVWRRVPPTTVVTCLAVTPNTVAAASTSGDVLIFNKKGGLVRCVRRLHELAATSVAPIGRYVATGGLDSRLCLTENTAKVKMTWWLASVLVVILAIVVFRLKQ
jgi:WD40 repeat protein